MSLKLYSGTVLYASQFEAGIGTLQLAVVFWLVYCAIVRAASVATLTTRKLAVRSAFRNYTAVVQNHKGL
jgi:hypothetical protein